LKPIVHALAISLLALSLAPAAVEAAPHSKHVVKKAHGATIVKRARVTRSYAAGGRGVIKANRRAIVRAAPASAGQLAGLHSTEDDLNLRSSVALVMDADTKEVLLRKNDSAVLPIASLTKLMTGLVLSEAKLPMDDRITITQDDVDTEKHSSSRLRVGTTLTREELMHLALMSSENRAAHALGRTYPGGMNAFVEAMNAKAQLLGMKDTRYVEPTGLNPANHSSAQDLARLVSTASHDPLLREFTTSPAHEVAVGNRLMEFHNTNRLVKNPNWDIFLQKTGFINEAGQCLVMKAKVAGRQLIMVFLDSAGRLSRIGDAERVRHWVETKSPGPLPSADTLVRQVNG
jgi:D-alanyl-D-alanine endopeptidase (penicillin-binding protein 7)